MWVGGHAQVGWFAARIARLEKRDRCLVALAAMLPDLDGLSIAFGYSAYYRIHHVWLHNVFACAAIALLVAAAARRKVAVFFVAAAGILLHVLSDGFGLLALMPLWPASRWTFWPNDERYWLAAMTEIGVPVLLISAQVWLARRDGTSILEMLPSRWQAWLAARWAEHVRWKAERARSSGTRDPEAPPRA
jgi:membrane-bound metal-dependent hydrolase YbcI (DUF457 family)